jgi:hypothetical protein
MAFDTKEQEIITWGVKNGKTKQEITDALVRYRTGAGPVTQQTEPATQTTKPDSPGFADNVKKDFADRVDTASNAIVSSQHPVSKVLQTIGEGAGFIGDVTMRTLGAVTPQPVKDALSSAAGAVADTQLVQDTASAYQEWRQKHPEAAANLEAIGNIASILPIGKVAKTGADATASVASRIKSATIPKLPDPPSGAFKAIGNIASDIAPKAPGLRDKFVARAFGLSPTTDIANIKKSTGNDIGEFLARYDLIKDTPDETLSALQKFHKTSYNDVRDAVALVDDRFTFAEVPEMEKTIDFLIKDFKGRSSTEFTDAAERLAQMKKRGDFDLLEGQEVKAMFDRVESIYKKTGDVREALLAQDKANVVTPLRRFIEARVKEATGIDIRPINNNTQTAKAISDAIELRAGKSDTSSFASLGDLSALGFGSVLNPAGGVAALGVKKIFESAPMQLRLARFFAGKADDLNGLSAAELKSIQEQIRKELFDAIQDDKVIQTTPATKSTTAKTPIKKTVPPKAANSK